MRGSVMCVAAALAAFGSPAVSAAELSARSAADRSPRKVIVGTAMHAYWEKYPGLQARLDQLAGMVDRMAAESEKRYGRGLDLAVLPEVAVTGEISGDIVAGSVPWEGPVHEVFARKAREHRCYIVVPLFLLEDRPARRCSNAAILVGRDGQVVGTYRKHHLAVHTASNSMEGGMTPGKEVPVFDCDFGKLGIQICFDMEFDYGWEELARQGAELVAWPTQSPQTAHPAFRAMQHGFYIVSSTWRHNTSVFEPTGKITAQLKPPGETLVQEIDLSFAIVPWSPTLQKGEAFSRRYGAKAGYRYYEEEDLGIFWSNDPVTTIGQMTRSLGLTQAAAELQRIRKLYHQAGVPGYEH